MNAPQYDQETLSPNDQDSAQAANPVPQEASEEFDLSESVILIVDDNEQNVELLQAYLESLPCRILTAFDGLEAIKIIEDADQPTPDLILLDVMMPRMSGFEVCRKLKEDPATRAIPIMMVTALNELGDIERGVESGTDDFVTKPVNKLELITRVKSLLRVRHLKRELDRTEAYIRDIERLRTEEEG
jgi:CheY-like chemotaxis protein